MEVKIAEVPIEVAIFGKIQDKDLEFTLSVDEKMSTFPASQCILPEKCIFKGGQLLDTIYVKLRNSSDLKNTTKIVALKINAGGEVGEGVTNYSRAIIAVTDRLVKPDWWDYKDLYDGEYSSNGTHEKPKTTFHHFYLPRNDPSNWHFYPLPTTTPALFSNL